MLSPAVLLVFLLGMMVATTGLFAFMSSSSEGAESSSALGQFARVRSAQDDTAGQLKEAMEAIRLLKKDQKELMEQMKAASQTKSLSHKGAVDEGRFEDVSNVRVPTRLLADGTYDPLPLEDRIRYLEMKLNAALNWVENPRVGSTQRAVCKNQKKFDEMQVCLDNIKKNDCIVYDYGLREQPELGLWFAEEYGCEVHGFDPSPVSVKYFNGKSKDSAKAASLPNYHFHPIGAGGVDGDLTLFEYNWGQVSSLKYPYWTDPHNCSERKSGPSVEEKKWDTMICESHNPSDKQGEFTIPVRTLKSAMVRSLVYSPSVSRLLSTRFSPLTSHHLP